MDKGGNMELNKTVDALKALIEEIAGLDDREVFTILSALADEYDWELRERDPGPEDHCTICMALGPQHEDAEDCFDHAPKAFGMEHYAHAAGILGSDQHLGQIK